MLIMAQLGQDKPMKSGFRMCQLASSNRLTVCCSPALMTVVLVLSSDIETKAAATLKSRLICMRESSEDYLVVFRKWGEQS